MAVSELPEPNIRPVRPSCRYIVAADLGQSHDPTAVSILRHTIKGTGTWQFARGSDKIREEVGRERLDLVYLRRLPLRLSYPQIVDQIADLCGKAPIAGNHDLLIDETGVGRAVADIFETSGIYPWRVTITAGSETSTAGRRLMVPKGELISTLDAKLSTGTLKFAAGLRDLDALKSELADFRRRVSPTTGRAQYTAREGRHDDLVLSLAIGCWWSARPRRDHLGTVKLSGIY